ncbi:MAG: hypothetical protein EZS28_010060, partial [Streblomastix strix]
KGNKSQGQYTSNTTQRLSILKLKGKATFSGAFGGTNQRQSQQHMMGSASQAAVDLNQQQQQLQKQHQQQFGTSDTQQQQQQGIHQIADSLQTQSSTFNSFTLDNVHQEMSILETGSINDWTLQNVTALSVMASTINNCSIFIQSAADWSNEYKRIAESGDEESNKFREQQGQNAGKFNSAARSIIMLQRATQQRGINQQGIQPSPRRGININQSSLQSSSSSSSTSSSPQPGMGKGQLSSFLSSGNDQQQKTQVQQNTAMEKLSDIRNAQHEFIARSQIMLEIKLEFEKLVKEMMENFADFIALYPAHYAGNSGDQPWQFYQFQERIEDYQIMLKFSQMVFDQQKYRAIEKRLYVKATEIMQNYFLFSIFYITHEGVDLFRDNFMKIQSEFQQVAQFINFRTFQQAYELASLVIEDPPNDTLIFQEFKKLQQLKPQFTLVIFEKFMKRLPVAKNDIQRIIEMIKDVLNPQDSQSESTQNKKSDSSHFHKPPPVPQKKFPSAPGPPPPPPQQNKPPPPQNRPPPPKPKSKPPQPGAGGQAGGSFAKGSLNNFL